MTATLPALRSVAICPTVRTELCKLAFDAFTSRPGEGDSISGVLLGRTGRDGVEVTDFRQGVENRADVVGYWSIARRLSQALPGEGVLMVVAPVTVRRAEAIVWQRAADGAETEGRRMTFQIERRAPKREDRRAELKPAWDLLGWGLAVGCVVLAALTIWMMRAEASVVPAARVALELESGKNELRVRWRESGMGRLESAALVVRQGSEESTVDLLNEFKPEGGLTVRLTAPVVVVSLRVRREGQPAIMRTVTYLEPGREKGNRRAGELEWLRWRNRDLEAKVAAMQARF